MIELSQESDSSEGARSVGVYSEMGTAKRICRECSVREGKSSGLPLTACAGPSLFLVRLGMLNEVQHCLVLHESEC